MVSMKDIADKCSVSVATVSKALNDHKDIGEDTKKHIREIAEKLGNPRCMNVVLFGACCGLMGADGVDWAPLALEKAKRFESDPKYADYCTMMVKTHLSLTHDPTLKGVPKGWRLPVKDILIYSGAGLLVPVAGEIKLMPGTSASPAYRKIDVDVETGRVRGLF